MVEELTTSQVVVNNSITNYPVPDIDKIINDCQKGDRQAQKTLYELFAPKMFAICLRYNRNRMEAEDLLHEGFIKVFTKIEQFKGTGHIEAWIRRLMVNTILEEFRNKKKLRLVEMEDLPTNIIDEEDENNDKTPDLDQIMQLITNLPEKYRMVFNLYVVEGFSHEDIAKEMGISVGTSKSNLSRARQWLKSRIIPGVTYKNETLW